MSNRKQPAPKRGASRYQPPPKAPVPGWIWLACILLVGGFIALLLQLQPGGEDIRRAPAAEPPKAGLSAGPATAEAPPAPAKPKYDFYTLLPESEVIVPPDALPPPPAEAPAAAEISAEEAAKHDAARAQALLDGETPPPPPVVAKTPPSTRFFLQAGSFRNRADAEKLRAQIILLGQSVQVESGTVREQTWHRVLVGPYASREELATAQKTLAGNGYSNLLLQQRR